MAFLLGCEKVKVDFPAKEVFSNLTLGVDEGARIGIVGCNGDGKSTLLRLLAGTLEPDEGRVIRTRGVTVGLLEQTDSLDDASTVHQAVVGDAPEYEWAANPRIRDILQGLLADIPWEGLVSTLSGGQRRRVDLARLLVNEWNVIALDEPTNHLDMRAISWLSRHLKKRWRKGSGALLVVTHDRWFLDEVCLDMWEVHHATVSPFEGGFSAYIMQRVERDRLEALAAQKRRNLLRRELAWLSRGARARATKPKFHVEAARALIADVPPLRNPVELKRMAMARIGKDVVSLENVSVSFDGGNVLDDVSWIIGPGDRYGILGENGAGKTTLLRIIQGVQRPTRGCVKIGKTVRFAVLSQHLDELNEYGNDRVRQVIGRFQRRTMLDGKEQTPGQLLEHLGFSGADQNEPVCDLSGGQKRRLALMLILLEEPNVLILDEPGNDLDTDMIAAVEDLLDGWPGTLILVTHDRYLMERVVDDQFAVVDGSFRHLPGGVDEYLRIMDERQDRLARKAGFLQDEEDKKNEAQEQRASVSPGFSRAPARGSAPLGVQDEEPAVSRRSGGEIRALRKTMASAERKMETLRGKIEVARQGLLEVNQSDFEALVAQQHIIDELVHQVEELELVWMEAAEELGE